MDEKHFPKRKPNWPTTFAVQVRNKQQAETLACALIRVERWLRRRIREGDFRHMNLADSLATARRRFQEDSLLVLNQAEIDDSCRAK